MDSGFMLVEQTLSPGVPALPSFDPESTAQDYPLNKVINVGATLTF